MSKSWLVLVAGLLFFSCVKRNPEKKRTSSPDTEGEGQVV